ncbi:hypothetical protein C2845_PM16G13870 [Panicum miliaceum]|uniref:Uncharacterized protein n=1 Tax=Panicum miliaceum TaxID=4540 RepID=A0A3L6PU94_PANMI|nr:hypothetical protein C2845_PM16G13870 [Panicum miliaceum]
MHMREILQRSCSPRAGRSNHRRPTKSLPIRCRRLKMETNTMQKRVREMIFTALHQSERFLRLNNILLWHFPVLILEPCRESLYPSDEDILKKKFSPAASDASPRTSSRE